MKIYEKKMDAYMSFSYTVQAKFADPDLTEKKWPTTH